jgi:hypothetical protein
MDGACSGLSTNAHKNFFRKHGGKEPLARHKCRWRNIMGVDWSHLAQVRGQWWSP